MTKKKAILLVLGAEAVIYLGLLVGLPMFTEWLYSSCSTCTGGRELGIAILPVYRILYFVPGAIGVWFILVIIGGKRKEAKNE